MEPLVERAYMFIELLNEQIADNVKDYENSSEEDRFLLGSELHIVMLKGQRDALIEYRKTL